jgi:hypothetical protein
LQFNKYIVNNGINKPVSQSIQNKQTFLEQYRKSKQLDTGDIGGSLPVTSLHQANASGVDQHESGRYSPMKNNMPMPGNYKQSFEENKFINAGSGKLKVSKPI